MLGRALRWSGRRAGIAVTYHRVGNAPGDPDGELVPALGSELFASQLRHLRRHYRVVAASDVLDAARRRRRGQRFPVAITFDDDLESHAQTAMPVLRRLGLRATFFLCGASLSGPRSFWWERLQRAVDNEGGRRDIHELAHEMEEMDPGHRRAMAAALVERAGPDPSSAGIRADRVSSLAGAGFEIGFHTRDHDPLPSLDDAALDRALREGREPLAALAGHDLASIAYPHGRADDRVARAARAAGFRWGFTNRPRAIGAGDDPLLLGRLPASSDDLGRFAADAVRALAAR